MELLLILSALLSAATGALTGARGPEAEMRQETAAETVAMARSAAAVVAPAQPRQADRPRPIMRSLADRAPTDLPHAKGVADTDRLIE